jgi:hypothetical protein
MCIKDIIDKYIFNRYEKHVHESFSYEPYVDTSVDIGLVGPRWVYVHIGDIYVESGVNTNGYDVVAVISIIGEPDIENVQLADITTYINTSCACTYNIRYTTTTTGIPPTVMNRVVIVHDTTPPNLTLTGDVYVIHKKDTMYTDKGASTENTGDIITMQTDVNPYVTGEYSVIYTAMGRYGESTTKVRNVYVS